MLLFVNYGDTNELKVIIDLDSSRSPIISDDKGKGTAGVALDSSFSLSKSQDVKVTEVQEFKEKNANKIVTHKEGRNDSSYEFLISTQEKQLKMQSVTIFLSTKGNGL